MSGKAPILQAVKANKPALVELPTIDESLVIKFSNPVEQFANTLRSIGGEVRLVESMEAVAQAYRLDLQQGKRIVNGMAELGPVDDSLKALTAIELASVDKAYLKGTIGVAENGAIWLYESQMINRLLPFICQHLVLVVEAANLAATMHQALQRISIQQEGFGVFIAGPSKTADIEQSLVIGAHGPVAMTAYIIA